MAGRANSLRVAPEIHGKLHKAMPAQSFPRKWESSWQTDADPRFRGGDDNLWY